MDQRKEETAHQTLDQRQGETDHQTLDQRQGETDHENLDQRQETDHPKLEHKGSHPEDSLTHNPLCGKVILVRGVVWIQ